MKIGVYLKALALAALLVCVLSSAGLGCFYLPGSPPTANITASPGALVTLGTTITFKAINVQDYDDAWFGNYSQTVMDTVNQFTWDFGDGGQASGATQVSHTYSAVGNYTVTLTINDMPRYANDWEQQVTLVVKVVPASLTVVYVDKDSILAPFDGTSWQHAYRTVQEGLNQAAQIGAQEVWVAEGTYYERITLKPNVGLYGGFAGSGIVRNPSVYVTTLDGSQAGNVVTAANLSGAAATIDGFTIRNGKADSGGSGGGIFCGYNSSPTITNNRIKDNSADSGGGISAYCAAPTISNNLITSNTSTGQYDSGGGGIFCWDSSPTIVNNTISGNNAIGSTNGGGGGGIFALSGSPTIAHNIISNNSAGYLGGGIYCQATGGESIPTEISENTIRYNTAGYGGGGIASEKAYNPPVLPPVIERNSIISNTAGNGGGIFCWDTRILHNFITNNRATGNGGGIFCWEPWGDSVTEIVNNIIARNRSEYDISDYDCGGGGIFLFSGSPTITNNTIIYNWSAQGWGCGILSTGGSGPTIDNNIIAFNSSGIWESARCQVPQHNCVYNSRNNYCDLLTIPDTDIQVDPQLVRGYKLQWSSPCVDGGINDAPGLPDTDIDGEDRIKNGTVDIGADEY